VDFVDRVHANNGTGFQEIRPWRPLLEIPVEIVDVVAGTDSSSLYVQERLGKVFGKGMEPGCIAGGQDEAGHEGTSLQ
jgi:hypothetical protein